MEERLLKIFKLLNKLNDEHEKIYVEIKYTSYRIKSLEISIREKKDFSYISTYRIELFKNSLKEFDDVIKVLESYVRGAENE